MPPTNELFRIFSAGVSSADPSPGAVIIWTNVALPAGVSRLAIEWELSSDPSFLSDCQRGTTYAEARSFGSIRVDVYSLRPDTHYFYRFRAAGETSPAGRTRTMANESPRTFTVSVQAVRRLLGVAA